MCTAVVYRKNGLYFGRNLDYEHGFGERVVITPKNYRFEFCSGETLKGHYAIAGVAAVANNYPLYYDAVNEKGLCIAGLNFVGNAVYGKEKSGARNVAQFELIPYILAKCANIAEMRELFGDINITDTSFSADFPASQLHWLAADDKECVVIECVSDGIKLYDNPIGILTNNPPFPIQRTAINDYICLSPKNPPSARWDGVPLSEYSRGMGAMGLPGDLSSRSRFVRAAFVKSCSVSSGGRDSINQAFHILDSVKQVRGCCITDSDEYEYTIYSSCCDAKRGVYYITTYDDRSIKAFDMNSVDLSADELYSYSF